MAFGYFSIVLDLIVKSGVQNLPFFSPELDTVPDLGHHFPGGLGKSMLQWIQQKLKKIFGNKAYKTENQILVRMKIMAKNTTPGDY